jgi:Mrp family chromosome partitioning ATPase/capsular polysaccharide biosynthesis protein
MENRDIRELVEPLRRRWWIVAAIALVISAITYLHYRGSPPTYTASTTVYVQPSPLDALLGGTAATTDADRTVNNQARLVMTPAVANEVARKLNFKGDPRELLTFVNAVAAENSDFVQIEATASDPQFAADVANGFAEGFVRLGRRQLGNDAARARDKIQGELSGLAPVRENRAVRRDLEQRLASIAAIEAAPTQAARQVDRALPPAVEGGPGPKQAAIFAGLLGLVLGGALAYGLEAIDRRLPTSSVEAEYGMPVLASIPLDRKAAAEARGQSGLSISMVEPIRTVRTTLDHEVQGGTARTILVMSAIPGEGKSTLTKGLALAFHGSGKSVLVIDADLRYPVLHDWFGAPMEPGLSNVLRSQTSFELVTYQPSLDVDSADGIHIEGEPEPNHEPVSVSAKRGSAEEKATPGSPSTTLEPPVRDFPPGLFNSADGDASQAIAPSGNGNRRREPLLHLMSSGSPVRDPAALLGTEQMASVLVEAKTSYDVVVIDSSPLLVVSDAIPLAAAVDGVIAVSRSNLTTRDDAQRFSRALDRLREVEVLGLVLNGVRGTHASRYAYAGYQGPVGGRVAGGRRSA